MFEFYFCPSFCSKVSCGTGRPPLFKMICGAAWLQLIWVMKRCCQSVSETLQTSERIVVIYWKTESSTSIYRVKVAVGFVLTSGCISQWQSSLLLLHPQHSYSIFSAIFVCFNPLPNPPPPESCSTISVPPNKVLNFQTQRQFSFRLAIKFWNSSWQKRQRDTKGRRKYSIYSRVAFPRGVTGQTVSRLRLPRGDSERCAPLVRPFFRGAGQLALSAALLVVALLHETGHVLKQGLWVRTCPSVECSGTDYWS